MRLRGAKAPPFPRRRVGHNALGEVAAAPGKRASSPRILTNAPTGAALRRRVGHNALGVKVAAAGERASSPHILTNALTGAARCRRVGRNASGVKVAAAGERASSPRILTNAPTGQRRRGLTFFSGAVTLRSAAADRIRKAAPSPRHFMPSPASHPNDPLHGITLETIVTHLVDQHGWEEMGRRIPIRCFLFDPSVKSSLTFLRKTPWARLKVEEWYVTDQIRRHL